MPCSANGREVIASGCRQARHDLAAVPVLRSEARPSQWFFNSSKLFSGVHSVAPDGADVRIAPMLKTVENRPGVYCGIRSPSYKKLPDPPSQLREKATASG